MSFQAGPDIDPATDIDLCDSVNLLLTSIAMEEMSLSKLMDAEQDKMRYSVNNGKGGNWAARDVIDMNKSVHDMMKTMIKLQMLLQFKLENVQELLPCTTCTHADTPQHCRHDCCLMGTGKGKIQNCLDPFCGFDASIHGFILCGDEKNNALRYTVGDEDDGLYFYAAGREVKADCSMDCMHELKARGSGRIKRYSCNGQELVGRAAYTLTVGNTPDGQLEFRIELTSCTEPCFCHDSGFVRVNSRTSDLRLGGCR